METEIEITKMEAARRQLETAIELYFNGRDEISTHSSAGAAYAILRDINEHRGGPPMVKDLHYLLDDLRDVKEFKSSINRAENFLKHADKDPDGRYALNCRWTEMLMWEASMKYCEITNELRPLMLAFILWFAARFPGARKAFEEHARFEGLEKQLSALMKKLPSDRREFWRHLVRDL